jgi:hypothetical protein
MSTDEGERDEGPSGTRDRFVAVLIIESIALAIALVSPVTPSKTGSTWSPAEFFTTDPSYLQKVLAAFVTVHLIIAVLGVVVWIASRSAPGSRPSD